MNGAPEDRQGVHLADVGVDEIRLVMLPARLILLAPPMVVEGEQNPALTLGDAAR